MAYLVELTARAERDFRAIYQYVQADTSHHAAKWFAGLEEAVFSLENTPRRGTVTKNSPDRRSVLYGNKPHFYRIVYRIDEPALRVYVLYIRHGARKTLSSG